MLPRIEPGRKPSPHRKLYTSPRLTELGNIGASEELIDVSPEMKVTLLALTEIMNRHQSGN